MPLPPLTEQNYPQATLAALRLNKYMPQFPTPKQAYALLLPHLEVLFGGSAGPGKSSWLLMSALQYVDVPGYAAVLFRRTYVELALPEALMDRAHTWLRPTDAQWIPQRHTYLFPSGAQLVFSHLEYESSMYAHQSAAYQFVGFDEVTSFTERMYRFLFSRLRRLKNFPVPLRMRAASNPGGIGHCVPYGEVLTPSGWKDIRSFSLGDPVYTVLPNGHLQETFVAQVHQSTYEGPLVVANARGLHMACTPHHAVAKLLGRRHGLDTRRGGPARFSLVPFDELPGQATILRTVAWQGISLPPFSPPSYPTTPRKHRQPSTLAGTHFAALLGWVLSEGCCIDRDKAFFIAQMKPENRTRIADLLTQCGFIFSQNSTGFTVYAPDWWAYFRDLGKCREKYIPLWVKAGSKHDLEALFMALMDGDGHWVKRGAAGQYYTTSAQLADDVAEVAIKLGYIVYGSHRQRENRQGLSYCVNIKRTQHGGTELLTGNHVYDVSTVTKRRSDIQSIPYCGPVYCLGIPETHSFVIRQQGSVWISGNSWVRQRFMVEHDPQRAFVPARQLDNPHLDVAAYEQSLAQLDPVTRQRLRDGDWDIAEEGEMFQRQWFTIVPDWPRGVMRFVRFWDFAGTEVQRVRPGQPLNDPDWTVGMLVGEYQGQYWVVDIQRVRLTPKGVEDLVRQTAQVDGIAIDIWLEQEPGSSGVAVIADFQRRVLQGYSVHAQRSTGSKIDRAKPASSAAEAGNIRLVQAAWNGALLDELALFPNAGHDDQVDALSGAINALALEKRAGVWGRR